MATKELSDSTLSDGRTDEVDTNRGGIERPAGPSRMVIDMEANIYRSRCNQCHASIHPSLWNLAQVESRAASEPIAKSFKYLVLP